MTVEKKPAKVVDVRSATRSASTKIKEGNKERIQMFEGVVIATILKVGADKAVLKA